MQLKEPRQLKKCYRFPHGLPDCDLVEKANTQHHHRPLEEEEDQVGKVVVVELEAVEKNGADPEVQLSEEDPVAREDQSPGDTK